MRELPTLHELDDAEANCTRETTSLKTVGAGEAIRTVGIAESTPEPEKSSFPLNVSSSLTTGKASPASRRQYLNGPVSFL